MVHPKNVKQFSDKINCVMLNLVGYIYIYKNFSAVSAVREPSSKRPVLSFEEKPSRLFLGEWSFSLMFQSIKTDESL